MLGVILLFLGLGSLHTITVPPLTPIDERSHFSYALEIRDGELPQIETPVREELVGLSGRKPRNTVWVANHPPLFYAAQALAIGDVDSPDDVPRAFLRGRMLSLAITAVGLWFVFLCARELCSPRSRLPVLMVALTVAVPQFSHVMALIHNDTLALLTSSCALYCAIIMLERGFSRRRYVALLICTALVVATRVSGLMIAVATLTALVIACWRAGSGGPARRSALAGAAALGVLLAVAATSGWFYLRNLELYGDITGSAVLFKKFHRRPHGEFPDVLLSTKVWWNFIEQLWGYYTGNIKVRPTPLLAAKYVGLVALIGVVIDAVIRLRSLTRERLRALLLEPRTLNLAMLLCVSALAFLTTFEFYSRGGNAHVRYTFSILWFLLAVPAIGLMRLGPRVPGVALTVLVLVQLLTIDAYVNQAHSLRGAKVRDLLLVSFELPEGIEASSVVLMLVAIAAGLSIVVGYLGAPPDQPEPPQRA